ncbi:MAG: xanthine dehydrogenase family protein [Deltaproteobacteria bacterium]|nr:xanthine dehydrogenase family protein [Deltaproteobacteria bacterium]
MVELEVDGQTYKVEPAEAALKEAGKQGLEPWGEALGIVGSAVPRRRGAEHVTGQARYSSDVQLPGMLHARLLLSPHAHARVRRIDASRALALPGVRAVLTCLNTDAAWDEERRLFDHTLRYAGQEVAAVAAADEEAAEEALELVDVEYEVLPAVLDPQAALMADAPQVRGEGNLYGGKPQVYRRGDVQRGLASAEVVHTQVYRTSIQHHACLEVHGCVASWDAAGLTVWDSTQGVHLVREELASRLKVPATKVRVVAEQTGGGFGSKNGIGPYHLVAVLLARQTGRPVRLFMPRAQEFIASHHRPATQHELTGGVMRDGRLMALVHRIIGQAGAYAENAELAAGAYGATAELYRCPNVLMEAWIVHTHTQSPGACRGPVGTEVHLALEQFIDELAEQLAMDPLAFRVRNYVRADQTRRRPYSSKALDRCYEAGARGIGWRWPQDPGHGRVRRGLGMSSIIWHGVQSEPSQAVATLYADGSLQLTLGLALIGTGSETALVQVAAEELGVSPDQVSLIIGDTRGTPYSIDSSYGSRTLALVGPAVRAAAAEVKRQLLARVARGLGAEPEALRLEAGQIVVRARLEPPMSVAEACRQFVSAPLMVTGRRPRNPRGYAHESFGAHFVEVEVDTETGAVRVLRAICAHDSGRIINRLLAESQVQGGFVQASGPALCEEPWLDPATGLQLNANLHDYAVPTALDVPDEVQALLIELPDLGNSIGAKGLGEPPHVGAGAAIANAVAHALGLRIREYPITRARVLEALRSAREAPGAREGQASHEGI